MAPSPPGPSALYEGDAVRARRSVCAGAEAAARMQIPIICGTACGALLTRPTPHFACNCRVCAAAPEAERLVFLSRNAFVTHLRDAGAFGNKKEGLLYVVQGDGSSAPQASSPRSCVFCCLAAGPPSCSRARRWLWAVRVAASMRSVVRRWQVHAQQGSG